MIRKMLAVLAMVSLLGACAIPSPNELDTRPQIDILSDDGTLTTIDPRSYAMQLQAQMVGDCKALERENAQKSWEEIGKLEGSEKLTALVGNQWKEAMIAINGQEFCTPGTNEYDTAVAYYESVGKVYSVLIKETGQTLRFTAGAGFGYMAVDSLANAIGNKIGNQINGDGNTVTDNDVNTNSTIKKTQVGTSESVIEGDGVVPDEGGLGDNGCEDGFSMTDQGCMSNASLAEYANEQAAE